MKRIFRNNKNTMAYAILILLSFAIFTACDDSSSGAGPDPVAEVSSSSGDEAISSSSVTDKGTSSGGGSVSSSSSVKSDMSSSVGTVQSSSSLNVKSSSSKAWTCKEEGKSVTRYNEATGLIDVYLCTNGVYELVVYSSSSEKVYTFKELFKEDSVFNKNMEYGTFVDSRDGQEYKTIEIYFNYKEIEYFTVFAQNLNYGTQVKLETTAFDDDKVEKFCYDDDPWYCEHYFGGLYSWSEAMGLPKACDSVKTGATPDCPDSVAPGIVYEAEWSELQIQGICPDGWHVMNEREWRALIHGDESASRAISKASYGGNESGFSALFNGGGFNDEDGCRYDHMQKLGFYWLPKERTDIAAGYVLLEKNRYDYSGFRKNYGQSIRCVKDYLSKSR